MTTKEDRVFRAVRTANMWQGEQKKRMSVQHQAIDPGQKQKQTQNQTLTASLAETHNQ